MGLLISKKRNTRLGRAIGAVVLCIECVAVAFVRGVSLGANAFYFQPSLSPILTGRSVIITRRSRLLWVSLPLARSFSAEVLLGLSALRFFSDVSAVAMDADAPRAQADNQQNRFSMALRPGESRTSRIFTHPRSPCSVGSHDLKNVAARHLAVCGPETNCCGTAVSSQI